MPLDVNPLSPARRVIMILLMLALLVLSLGFAQWLIVHQPAGAIASQLPADSLEIMVKFRPPAGLKELPVHTSADIEILKRSAEIELPQGTRALFAYYFEATDAGPLEAYLKLLLYRILPDPEKRTLDRTAQIAGISGLGATCETHEGGVATFAIIRLIHVPGHIVAFCLSGEGLLTDADRQFFDAYCAKQIEIRIEKPTRKG